jgi:predicted nucleotidyltransferase
MGNPRIFGSAARGEDNEQSDLDILIDATDRHPARNKRRR